MGKILFVAPYPEISRLAKATFRELGGEDWELEVVQATTVKAVLGREAQADVIIAQEIVCAALQSELPDIPVIRLPVTGYDVMRAIRECRERFGAARVAVVGSADLIYDAGSMGEIAGIEIETAEVGTEDDVEPTVGELAAAGVDAVVGGILVAETANRLRVPAVLIRTGPKAVWHAVYEAMRVVKLRRLEQERHEQLRAILEYSAEGIVAIDRECRINLINKAAIKLTGARGRIVGQHVDQVIPQLGLSKTLGAERAESGEIGLIGGQQVAINRVPIVVNGQTVGAVATFEPISAIQELEGKIREKIYLRGHVAKANFEDILGNSEIIRATISTARQFSQVDSNVLILGESGTGKEIFAQSIHNASQRRSGPFVAVNCAALPESLLESELFGYVEGAFTGASRGGKIGLFELAHRGTIFLDEISEISPKIQGRLLRVLQEREIMRLGGDRVIPVDLRVIAASNRDPYQLMRLGAFREDLYYRLNILNLTLAPLRERQEDIIPLMRHYLGFYSARFGRSLMEISRDAQRLLLDYAWPGNVRELRNIAERLVVLNITGSTVASTALAAMLAGPAGNSSGPGAEYSGRDLGQAVLLKALEENHYHYGRAAAALGISRTTLWRRLRQSSTAR